MFQVTRVNDKRIDVELSGQLDTDDMKLGLIDLFTETEGIEQGRMFYRVHGFDLPTLGGIAIELSRFADLLRCIKQFNRIAVVTEKKWLRKVSELEGLLLPNVEVKGFDADEIEIAEQWLNDNRQGNTE